VILLVTREVVAENEPGAYEVLNHFETAGFSSTAGPHIRFNEFRVPDRNLLAAPGGNGAEILQQCFTATAACKCSLKSGRCVIMVARILSES